MQNNDFSIASSLDKVKLSLIGDNVKRFKSISDQIALYSSEQIKQIFSVDKRIKLMLDGSGISARAMYSDLFLPIQLARNSVPLHGDLVGALNLRTAHQIVKDLQSFKIKFDEVKFVTKKLQLQNLSEASLSPLLDYFVQNGDVAEEMVGLAANIEIGLESNSEADVISSVEIEEETEVVARLKEGSRELTAKQWRAVIVILVFMYHMTMTILDRREDICLFQPKIASSLSNLQAVKDARAFLCQDTSDPDFSKYRLVKGAGVRLRVGPGTKQPEIAIVLQDRALLEVINNQNRNWLLVKVVDEDVEGWISRGYTHRLK